MFCFSGVCGEATGPGGYRDCIHEIHVRVGADSGEKDHTETSQFQVEGARLQRKRSTGASGNPLADPDHRG